MLTIIRIAALLVLVPLLCRCATPGSHRTASLRTVQEDLAMAVARMTAAEEALERLIDPDAPPSGEALEEFGRRIEALEQAGARLAGHADEVRVRGEEYVQELDRKNAARSPEVQDLGDQLRDALSSLAQQAGDYGEQLKTRLDDYMARLRQIRNRIAAGVSPAQHTELIPFARKTIDEGKNLRVAMESAVRALDGLKPAPAR